METAKIIISRNDSSPLDKRELNSLLSFFENGYEYDNVIIGCGYLIDIIKTAIDGLSATEE